MYLHKVSSHTLIAHTFQSYANARAVATERDREGGLDSSQRTPHKPKQRREPRSVEHSCPEFWCALGGPQVEQEEELIANKLMKRLELLKREKQSLAREVEQEEEYLTNNLQKRMFRLGHEKADLENRLEAEQARLRKSKKKGREHIVYRETLTHCVCQCASGQACPCVAWLWFTDRCNDGTERVCVSPLVKALGVALHVFRSCR